MASPPHESTTICSYLDLDEEVVYGSNTNFHGDEDTLSPTRLFQWPRLILYQTHSPRVAKPTRPRCSIKPPMWVMPSSPIRLMGNNSWLSIKRRSLGSINSLLQPLIVAVNMCLLHSMCKNVYSKQQAVHWQRGPLALNAHLLKGLRVDRHFARST